jgi:hypothetical protein
MELTFQTKMSAMDIASIHMSLDYCWTKQ